MNRAREIGTVLAIAGIAIAAFLLPILFAAFVAWRLGR